MSMSDREHSTAASPLAPGAPRPVWLIAVGDELLQGRTLDTNSRYLARSLRPYGVVVQRVTQVPDEAAAIATALDATGPGGLVFLCGGLGSTPDDLTRDAVADWAGVALPTSPLLRAELEERCRRRGLPCGDWILRQAQVPVGMQPVTNLVGSAPALIGGVAGRLLVLLPGVPGELRALLPQVLSRLRQDGHLPPASACLLYRTAQLAETTLVRWCEPLRAAHPELQWSWWLVRYGVDVQVTFASAAVPAQEVADLDQEIRSRLNPWVYTTQEQGLNEVVQERMISRGRTLSVAESCTAGLLGARLTEVAGSSAFFKGGTVVYADEAKRDLLAVPESVLATAGAVSREVVVAMADGCRRRFGTHYAAAITGIAGPEGGSDEKPVGTTWLAVACPEATWARRYHFPGTRTRNRQLATAAALDTLRRLLVWGDDTSPWRDEDSWGRSA